MIKYKTPIVTIGVPFDQKEILDGLNIELQEKFNLKTIHTSILEESIYGRMFHTIFYEIDLDSTSYEEFRNIINSRKVQFP